MDKHPKTVGQSVIEQKKLIWENIYLIFLRNQNYSARHWLIYLRYTRTSTNRNPCLFVIQFVLSLRDRRSTAITSWDPSPDNSWVIVFEFSRTEIFVYVHRLICVRCVCSGKRTRWVRYDTESSTSTEVHDFQLSI